MRLPGRGPRRLLSIVGADQLPRVLQLMLDEGEFLSPHGIRSVSRVHREHPFVLSIDGMEHRVDYEPAESSSSLFGGNSNWRGPVWFPVNYLLIESLQKFHHFFGDTPHGGLSHRRRAAAEPLGGRHRAVPAPHPHLPARRGRPAPGLRRHRDASRPIRTGGT